MQLLSIDDPRRAIEKLSRKELEYLARKEKRTDIVQGMPKKLMLRRFEAQPPSQLPRPMAGHLGKSQRLTIPPYSEWLSVAFRPANQPLPQPETAVETNAVDDLERQWAQQQRPVEPTAPPEPEPKPLPRRKNAMAELRSECKRRGISITRRDKKTDLEAKLDGQDAVELSQ